MLEHCNASKEVKSVKAIATAPSDYSFRHTTTLFAHICARHVKAKQQRMKKMKLCQKLNKESWLDKMVCLRIADVYMKL